MHAVICKPFIMQPSDASVAEESLFLLTFLYPGHKCQGHCSVLLWSVVTDSVVCDLISPLMLSVKKPLVRLSCFLSETGSFVLETQRPTTLL